MLILLLLIFVSTCAATKNVSAKVTTSNDTAIPEKAMTGNEMITYGMIIDDLEKGHNETGLNLDQVCLRGYVKAISFPNNSTTRLSTRSNPVSLLLTLCTPQVPVCMSRRDTASFIGANFQTQYYRFGCRKARYWKDCNSTKTEITAVFCGTHIRAQLIEGTSIKSYFDNLTQITEVKNRIIRYVSMSEKKRRDLYSDYGDVHDHVVTGKRTYKKMYALLVIMLVAGGYKTWTTYIKLLHYKRNTQVNMDDPNDTDEDYKTSNSSSTDSNIHH